jgi:hypothetical protein
LNSHSEKRLFFLQFEKITVYSLLLQKCVGIGITSNFRRNLFSNNTG